MHDGRRQARSPLPPPSGLSVILGDVSAVDPRIFLFYDYWRRACKSGEPPSRADIDPLDMPRGLLPHVILAAVIDGGDSFRFKLVGSAVESASQMSLTGQIVGAAMANHAYRDYVIGLCREVVRTRIPHVSVSNFAQPTRDHITTHRIMCPLAEPGGEVTMIFACQFFDVLSDRVDQNLASGPGGFRRLFEAVIEPTDSP